MISFDNPSSNFKNHATMVESGLVDAGWIPAYIPKSAVQIYETHHLDTNIININFQYNPCDSELARSNCNSEINTENGIILLCDEGRLELLSDGKEGFLQMLKTTDDMENAVS